MKINKENFDAIIIGSGIGGLVTASQLAAKGAKVLVLEKCENTFDYLLENDLLKIEELESAIFQIITILLTYQKVFKFTHNDLHTNNIMYVPTDETHITYIIEGKTYKVPTFGKIYKIIDFGRSIYQYQGKLLCSDSFSSNGTAHTQYNFGPYYNPKKPVIEPNYSFDLCRVACSIFDFICDEATDYDRKMERSFDYSLRSVIYKFDSLKSRLVRVRKVVDKYRSNRRKR